MWLDFDSLRAASLIANFEVEMPENPQPDLYPNVHYRAYTNVVVEEWFTNDEDEEGVRFSKAYTCDGSELYEANITFRSTNIVDVGDIEVTERGDGDTISMASWSIGDYSYSILALNTPISIIIQAIGKVREYHLRVEFFTILCPIITYFLFKSGVDSYWGYYTMILMISLSHLVRMVCLKKFYKPFDYREYLLKFLLPAIVIAMISMLIGFFIHGAIQLPFLRFIVLLVFSVIFVGTCAFYIGMTRNERSDVVEFVKGFFNRFIQKK